MKAALAVAALVSGCASEAEDLLADEGTPSSTADELMGKRDSVVTDRISGVYERTGLVVGFYQSPIDGLTKEVRNNWVLRIEVRETKLVTGMECALTYNETGRAPKTLVAFIQQEVATTDTYYNVISGGADRDTDTVSMTDCTVEQGTAAWAYCGETVSGVWADLPEGASECIGRHQQSLEIVRSLFDTDDLGIKVAN